MCVCVCVCVCVYICVYMFVCVCACMCMLSRFNHGQLLATLWTGAPHALCPWDSPGKNTGVGCRTLLQGIFLTQGLNPCLLKILYCRWILYH